MNISVRLIIYMFVLSYSAYTQDKLSSEDIYSKCKEAIVQVYCYDINNTVLASGSGVIVSPDGVVFTNYHVIQKSVTFQIRSGDEIYNNIPCVGFDPFIDIAILKLPYGNYPFLNISNVVNPVLGSNVYAFGNPENYTRTLSIGVLSAVRLNEYPDMIQFSAPISHGSSGGALLNQYGEVIGITTSMNATGQNINFAVPSKYLVNLPVIDQNDSLQVSLLQNIVNLYTSKSKLSFDENDSIINEYCKLYKNEGSKWEFAGRFYQNIGNDDSAIVCLTRAIEISCNDRTLYELRANSYANNSDTAKALADYDKSISLCNTCTEGYVARSHYYHYTLKEYQKALDDYYKIAEIKPENYFVYTRTADCRLKLGDKVGAIKELSLSLEWELGDADIYNTRAEIFKMLEKYEDAIADYTKSIQCNPFQIDLYWDRALLYSKNEDNISAIRDYQEYLKYNPDKAIVYNNLGYCYMKENNILLSEQYFNQSLKIDQRNINSYIGLAILNYSNGNIKLTIQNMCRAIELNDILLHGMPGLKELEHSGWFWSDDEKVILKKIFKLIKITDTKIEPIKDLRPKSKKIRHETAKGVN